MGLESFERRIKYSALPSQKQFHRSTARFKGFSGPIGSGKSQALCQEAIRLSYLNPGRTGLVGAPTYPMLRDATLASLKDLLYENRIPFELNKTENVITMNETGSKILLRAVDEFERLRGTNLAWFGLDELSYSQEGAWSRLEGRLRDPKATRRCGFAVWTPKGFDWVYRKFVQKKVPGYETVLAKPYENRYLLDAVPDFYDRLKESYDENFYRQEVLGSYLNSKGGLVYSSFSRTVNVTPVEIDAGRPVYWAVDFNVDPMSSVVAQERGGDFYVLDEIVLRRATTEDACEEFAKRVGMPRGGVIVFGDASGAAQQTTGLSDHQVIKAFFKARNATVAYRIPKANPAVRARVMAVNAQLRNASGEARLFVDPRCKELIADFEEVSYKDDSTQIDKEKDRRRTHLSDALGYLICEQLRSGPVGEQTKKIF